MCSSLFTAPRDVQLLVGFSVSDMKYGLLMWGIDIDITFKLQKTAVRIITGNYNISHREPIF